MPVWNQEDLLCDHLCCKFARFYDSNLSRINCLAPVIFPFSQGIEVCPLSYPNTQNAHNRYRLKLD